MKMQTMAELLLQGMKDLSWWKPYMAKGACIDIGTAANEDDEAQHAVFMDEGDKFISIMGGEIKLSRNDDGTWDVEVWVQQFNNVNGYLDSDYSTFERNLTALKAISEALKMPVFWEMENWGEATFLFPDAEVSNAK